MKVQAELNDIQVVVETEKSAKYVWAIFVDNKPVISGAETSMTLSKAAVVKALVDYPEGQSIIGRCSKVEEPEAEMSMIDKNEKEPEPEKAKEDDLKLDSDESLLVSNAKDAGFYEGTIWRQTGRIIKREKESFNNKKRKEMSTAFSKLLDTNVHSSLIPDEGPDRKGEIIKLRKKSGNVKWSSWEVTARLVQNCTTIFTGIEKLGWDVCFPGGYELISRAEMDKLLKALKEDEPGEAPYKTVMRCLEMASKKMAEIEDMKELCECDPFVKDIMEAFAQQLEDLKES